MSSSEEHKSNLEAVHALQSDMAKTQPSSLRNQ